MLPPSGSLQPDTEAYDLFTRKEEYAAAGLDERGRFARALCANQDILDPVVSRLLVERGYRPTYPDGKAFALCLTHDVDDIYPPLTHIALSSLYCARAFNFSQMARQVLWKLNRRWPSPYLNFRRIMALESRYHARSTFYFMATERDVHRFRYRIEDLQPELRHIVENGWDVGLHTGYYSFDNMPGLAAEKQRLEQALGREIIGCRNHFLRFRVPNTWELLSQAGFKYDTTFGYHDGIGFRNGMCHPFRPVNRDSGREIDIVEIPMAVMDATLFQGANLDTGFSRMKDLIGRVETCHGVLTVDWHNAAWDNPARQKYAALYESMLDYCGARNGWLTSADEIYRWFSGSGHQKPPT